MGACAHGGVVVWRRGGVGLVGCCAALLAALVVSHPASAADLPPPPAPPAPPVYKAPDVPLETWSHFYIGGALNRTHHTGYVPAQPGQPQEFSAQQYAWGFKVFGGYRFTENVAIEAAYHHLGQVSFFEGNPIWSTEHSYAVSGSVVLTSPALSRWIGPTWVPVYFFTRFGLAYKDITHVSVFGTFNEGILSGVFGAGFEFRPTQNMFVRLEYEFLSTAIGGPPMSIPALNSLFNITFGGTHRAINVMNTPLALTVGVNLPPI
jgi:hypothetical protein